MPKKLLLADDSITIQKVVGITFAGEDFKIISVDNGEDAIARAREIRPDIVVADVVMPRKNGYEVCEAIKADATLRDIPVLLLAGTFEAFDESRARAAHADGHIAKPFESQALINRVKELVGAASAPVTRSTGATGSSMRPESVASGLPPAAPSIPAVPPSHIDPGSSTSPPMVAASQAPRDPVGAVPPPLRPSRPSISPVSPPVIARPATRASAATAAPVASPVRPTSGLVDRLDDPSPGRPGTGPRREAAVTAQAATQGGALSWSPDAAMPSISPQQITHSTVESSVPGTDAVALGGLELDWGGLNIEASEPGVQVPPALTSTAASQVPPAPAPAPAPQVPPAPAPALARAAELHDLGRAGGLELLPFGEPIELTELQAEEIDEVQSLDVFAPAPESAAQQPVETAPRPVSDSFPGTRIEFGSVATPDPEDVAREDLSGTNSAREDLPGTSVGTSGESVGETSGGAIENAIKEQQPAEVTRADAAVSSDGGEAQLREALSRASREVIERIAWEVVPTLAETIIREHIERLVKERQR